MAWRGERGAGGAGNRSALCRDAGMRTARAATEQKFSVHFYFHSLFLLVVRRLKDFKDLLCQVGVSG